MATTVEANAANPTATAAPTAWYRDQRRLLMAGGIALVVVAVVIYFITASGKRKEEFAARSLHQAQAAAEAGNLPLASSELQKLIQTYKGTEAAAAAVLTLNQIRLYNDQSALAAGNLQEFLAANPEPRYAVPAAALLGAALENAKRWGDAGDAYMQAAQKADAEFLKAQYLTDAGRAYQTGGMTEKAVQAYQTVIQQYSKAPNVAEAQVRLAELTDGKAGSGPDRAVTK